MPRGIFSSAIKNTAHTLRSTKADSLSGFIAGFIVGVIGMYVYVMILTQTSV